MNGAVVILGAGGQVARAWVSLLGGRALPLAIVDVNLADKDFLSRLEEKISGREISAIVNAAAYTQVDKAEGEGRADAMRVNAEAVGELAGWCGKRDIPFVHYSTDYVYDGGGASPRNEEAKPSPLNAYGESKLAGDLAVAAAGGRWLVFRTSWIYDAAGNNFFNTMLRLFKEKEEVRVVADQFGAPTYAPHLAAASLAALKAALAMPRFPSGVYHLCAGGETSWHGFAQAIFALARSRDSGIRCRSVVPIPTAEYKTPARRPQNSRLDCAKARATFGVSLPGWEEGLRQCIECKYGTSLSPASGPHAAAAETV